MNTWKIILLIIGIISFVYFIGRAFGVGIMDGVNYKFNQFTKSQKDDNEKKKE